MWPFRKRINVWAIIEPRCKELHQESVTIRKKWEAQRQSASSSVTDLERIVTLGNEAELEISDRVGKILGMKLAAELINKELNP